MLNIYLFDIEVRGRRLELYPVFMSLSNQGNWGLYNEGANSKSKFLDSNFIKVFDSTPFTAVVALLIYFLTKDSQNKEVVFSSGQTTVCAMLNLVKDVGAIICMTGRCRR